MMRMIHEWHRDDCTISTDLARLDVALIVEFLQQRSYWARDRSRATIERSLQHSLNFGLYRGSAQLGFARVVTDYAIFAYVCDVFVLESERGQGLGKWLMQTLGEHPDLPSLRRWVLTTQDAHGLYAQAGYTPLSHPERWMQRFLLPAEKWL